MLVSTLAGGGLGKSSDAVEVGELLREGMSLDAADEMTAAVGGVLELWRRRRKGIFNLGRRYVGNRGGPEPLGGVVALFRNMVKLDFGMRCTMVQVVFVS